MSRCFSYPPPGYEKKVTHDEALIESIKRKEEKTKRDRKKEKKREKKEKEKEKACKDENFENKKHKRKRGHNDERREDKKGDYQKKIEYGTEHLERSIVTEEQGHPVGSQNSLDSTLNSNKRLKQSSPHDSNHNFGSVFRIRMPSQRHRDPEVLPSKKQPSPASGKHDGISARGMCESPHKASREQGEQSCSTSRSVGKSIAVSVSKEMNGPPSFGVHCKAESFIQKLCGICPPAFASKLRDLVEDWIPHPVQLELADSGDQDWLSVSNQQNYRGHKRYTCSDDTSVGNSTSWPRACYLPEVDIYALPFTVPF